MTTLPASGPQTGRASRLKVGIIAPRPAAASSTAIYARELADALEQSAYRPQVQIATVCDVLDGPFVAGPAGQTIVGQYPSYWRAAQALNEADVDVVSLQHDFTSLPAECGLQLAAMLKRVHAPLVATLHDVPTHPTAEQSELLAAVTGRAARIVVLARKTAEILQDTHGVSGEQIAIIPCGARDGRLPSAGAAKAALGLSGATVLMTIGLLSYDMGLEIMLEALPELARRHPKLVYTVVGALHPRLSGRDAEDYLAWIGARAAELGVADRFRLERQHLDQRGMRQTLAAADIYISPYLSEAVPTSHVLTAAAAAGRPVLATPSWYATELFGDVDGALVPFGNPHQLAGAVDRLLSDPRHMRQLRRAVGAAVRPMLWPRVARAYLRLLGDVREERAAPPRLIVTGMELGAGRRFPAASCALSPPEPRLGSAEPA